MHILSIFHIDFISYFMISGPELPETLSEHSMVALGLGQAIIGGKSNGIYTNKISYLECSQGDCYTSKLHSELSTSRGMFAAIPIPDFLSGCIFKGTGGSFGI